MFQPIEGERQCTRCLQCKPQSAFSPKNSRCKACRAETARTRKIVKPCRSRLRAARPWSQDEVAVLFDYYPAGGVPACAPLLDRTQCQIKSKVEKLGLCRETPSRECWEPAWALPAHDYCEADLALRDWRGVVLPVVGTFAPGLGMRLAA